MIKRFAIPLFVTGAITLVAAFGMLTYQSVSAQAVTPTAVAPDTQTAPVGGDLRGPADFDGKMGPVRDEALADALGITTTELQDARQEAKANGLAKLVKDGVITQTQADRLSARDQGRLPFGGQWLEDSALDPQALLADALGISVDDLNAAQQKAMLTTIDEAVSAGKLTAEQADLLKGRQALANDSTFKADMTAAYQTVLNQAVSRGVITQAQANQLLQARAQHADGWNGFGAGQRPDGHGRRGGR